MTERGTNADGQSRVGRRSDVSLSIVVPAYNEEALLAGTVGHLLETAPRCVEEVEIVIVDDGSADATGRLADELAQAHDNVVTIHQPRNRGFGETVRTGFMRATKDYVMVCPADYHFTEEEFDIYLVLMRHADIVIGYRRERRTKLRFLPWLVSAGYHFLVNTLFRINFYDVNWIHMYRREQIGSFLGASEGVFFLAETMIRARQQELKVVGVDVGYTERPAGVPTGVKPGTILKTLRELFSFLLRGNRR